MDYEELTSVYNSLKNQLNDESQDDVSGVRAKMFELMMTAKEEAAICYPEIVDLWEEHEKFTKACQKSAAYIGSIVNKILEEEKENRCTLTHIPVSDNCVQGVIFSINLGEKPISGAILNQIITGIGKPCEHHYGLEIGKDADGNPQMILSFSGTCSEHLQAHYNHKRLAGEKYQPYIMSDDIRAERRASLYTIPGDVEVSHIHVPITSLGVTCIEAVVNGQYRADMLSALDVEKLESCFYDEELTNNFVIYLIRKYLLKDNCAWVSDGMPLRYLNRKDENKAISTREYYALPINLQKDYILFNPEWDYSHDKKGFPGSNITNHMEWLKSFEYEYRISSIISSKRLFGSDSRSIDDGNDKYSKDLEKAAIKANKTNKK